MADRMIPEGAVISHYRIDSRIGAGGMGEVFKAHDTTLERPVALKILPPSVLKSSDRVRRFVGEAKAASALNHPHIVTIHEIGQATVESDDPSGEPTKIHYIAMEFIEGATLRTHIYRETELKRLVEVMAQSAEGLAKAHNAGIVHRDLKPDNIMVTSDGYAKIVDFGLAKLTEKEGRSENVEQTEEGVILGTAGYMSPEQVQGKLVDQRSDIFSFGCILYECATQRKPFQSETAIDTMHRIVFGQPQPIGELNPDVPEELARIIRKCLAKEPDERYQTIKEVAVDLKNLSRHWEQQLTISGREMSFAPAFPESPRRTTAPGTQSLEEIQREPSAIPAGAGQPAEIPLPRRHVPIGRWIFRTTLLLVLFLAGWLWYTHPDVSRVESGALETFPRLASAPESADWRWLARENTAVPVRVAAVAAADPGFMERTLPTMDDLKKEGAIGRLFRQRKLPGLSPISRQVARNVLIEPGPLGAIQSWTVAVDLERSLPKTRILELYINTVEFEPDLFGVEAASRRRLGKSASSLGTDEAALLIASIGSPDADLRNPPEWLIARRDELLDIMGR